MISVRLTAKQVLAAVSIKEGSPGVKMSMAPPIIRLMECCFAKSQQDPKEIGNPKTKHTTMCMDNLCRRLFSLVGDDHKTTDVVM